jgi:hypothetical protein
MLRIILAISLVWHLTYCDLYPQEQTGTAGITIDVGSANGAKNKDCDRKPKTLTVRVRQPDQQPVADAEIWFIFPESGPSVQLSNGAKLRLERRRTNRDGLATVGGLVTNGTKGTFEISIEAFHQGQRCDVGHIRQENVRCCNHCTRNIVLLLIAAGIGVCCALRICCPPPDDDHPPPKVTVTPGPPNVSPPR